VNIAVGVEDKMDVAAGHFEQVGLLVSPRASAY
jgi:hypothetical protein